MVTANRRTQDIQKVAATVTAISATTIARQHLDSAADVAAFAPNVLGYNFDGRLRPRYYIRGVGNGNVANNAVGAIIREGATQKLYDVIIGGKAQGMQFMDDAIWEKLVGGTCDPVEAYMKAIDKSRFRNVLPPEHAELANSGGGEEKKK